MATVLHIDATTKTITERDETNAEAAYRAELHTQHGIEKQARDAVRASAIAKLSDLGLTPDEIAALVGA
jgi:hypothetical protein